jgi:hypothetical protein
LSDEPRKDRGSVQLSKMQRAADGKKSMSEYEANAAALRARTERLKALRLAKEASEPAAAPRAPAAKKAASGKTKKTPAGSLSDWLKSRQSSGRNN